MINVLSVDVEDYFHPSEVQESVDLPDWSSLPSRVEQATDRTLELLDGRGVKASFFVLGWVAEHYPGLVARIHAAGHEIGCHSYSHALVGDMGPDGFREDTRRAVAAIEDAAGVSPQSYRAPSYSITAQSLWALEILVEMGFTHDSSIYPIGHDRYGIPNSSRVAHVVKTASGPILEVPPATARLWPGLIAPVGGGAYLRLFPYRYTAAGIRRTNRGDGEPACIYFHPWEVDPDQPRLLASRLSRLRTYAGLSSMYDKLDRLLSEFQFAPLTTVHPLPGATEPVLGDVQ